MLPGSDSFDPESLVSIDERAPYKGLVMSQPTRFDLFLSYSTEPDYDEARDLERFLESFYRGKLSASLNLEPLNVCMDGSDFPLRRVAGTSPNDQIDATIVDVLSRSDRMLVLCSPNAARSPWVDKEVAWFMEHRGPEAILLAVTEGEDPVNRPEEVFSPRIREKQLHQATWYDFRGRRTRKGIKIRDYEDARVQLAAHLRGKSAGEVLPLWTREQERQTRRRRTFIGVAATVLLATLAAAALQWRAAAQASESARIERVRRSASAAFSFMETGDTLGALPWLLQSLQEEVGHANESSLRILLASSAVHAPQLLQAWPNGGGRLARFTRDGKIIILGGSSFLQGYDAGTGKSIGPALVPQRELLATALVETITDETTAVCISRQGIFLYGLISGHTRDVSELNGGEIKTARLSRNGTMALLVRKDHTSIWRLWKGEVELQLGFIPDRAWLSADGRWAVLSRQGKQAVLLETGSLEMVSIEGDSPDARLRKVSFTPDGRFFVAATEYPGQFTRIERWTTAKWDASGEVIDTKEPVEVLALSTDGRRVAFAAERGPIWIHDAETGTRDGIPISASAPVEGLKFTADGNTLVLSAAGVWMIRLDTRLPVHTVIPCRKSVSQVEFSPGSDQLLIICDERFAKLWALEPPKGITVVRTGAPVQRIAVSGDQMLLASGDEHSTRVGQYSMTTGEATWPPIELEGSVDFIDYSADRTRILFTSPEGWARVLDRATGKPIAAVSPGFETSVYGVKGAINPQGSRAIFVADDIDPEVVLYNLETGVLIGKPLTLALSALDRVENLEFSKDGRSVAITTIGGPFSTVITLDGETGSRRSVRLEFRNLTGSGFAGTDHLFTLGIKDHLGEFALEEWDPVTGKLLARTPIEEPLMSPKLSSDRTQVLGITQTSMMRSLRLDPASKHSSGRPFGGGGLSSFVRDANSRRVIVSRSGLVQVWDVDREVPLSPPFRHEGTPILTMAFDENGKRFVTGGQDGTARIWTLAEDSRPLSEWTVRASALSGRMLTPYGQLVLADDIQEEALWDTLRFYEAGQENILYVAGFGSREEVARLLMEQPERIHDISAQGETALHIAARFGRQDNVRELVARGAPLESKDLHGRTPLYLAVVSNMHSTVDALLAAGASPNVDHPMGTPLHITTHEEIARALLRHGARLDVLKNVVRMRPIHTAALNRQVGVLHALLDAGADPDARMPMTEETALGLAAGIGDVNAVRLLLERGADPNLADAMRFVPLSHAAMNCHSEAARVLLERGAKPDGDPDTWTPLGWATLKDCETTVELLLEKGANPNHAKEGRRPLSVARERFHLGIEKMLLAHGATE